MKTHLKIHIKGKVQKVAYRNNARKQAENFKIKGFVKNNPDGSVYIEAEGNTADLESFVAWCQKGPKYAYIESIDIKKGRLKNFEKFKIVI